MAVRPELSVDIVEASFAGTVTGRLVRLGQEIRFSTAALESYAFASFQPIVADALTVTAAIEYADKSLHRPAYGWTRSLAIRLPVYELNHWRNPELTKALHEALTYLTGDEWAIEFVQRREKAPVKPQKPLSLTLPAQAVLAYSNGLDSRAVAGIIRKDLGDALVCIRLASRSCAPKRCGKTAIPFTGVPYEVRCGRAYESTGRSRGFKFAMLSGIASFLVEASTIIVPESGQGAIGPALMTTVHAYPDYRNHPLFTKRMERLLELLFGNAPRFSFPRLWSTKAETLRQYMNDDASAYWDDTRSCWKSSQWSSVGGKRRQCGVCAACMLRRMSMLAAGVHEEPSLYIAEDLTASTIGASAEPSYKYVNKAFRDYAVAGVLQLDHFADMAREGGRLPVGQHAALLGPAVGLSLDEAEASLLGLVRQHAAEWHSFLATLGEESFVKSWTRRSNA